MIMIEIMKSASLIWYLYFGLLSNLFAQTGFSEEDLAQYTKEVANKLRTAIWDEWEVTVKGNTVSVKSKFNVHFLHTIGLGEIPRIDPK